jgi:hypothetical protein
MRITDLLQQGRGSDLLEEFAKASSSRHYLDDLNELLDLTGPDDLAAAAASLDGQEFAGHLTPGGTGPLATLQPSQRATIAEAMLGALGDAGVGEPEALRAAGRGDAAEWEADELARLVTYAKRDHPEAFGRAISGLRDHPSLLHRLLGNRGTQAIVLGLVTKLLADRQERPKA